MKNFMLFFPPFLAGSLHSPEVLLEGILPFLAFSLASSSIYIANDIADRKIDLLHPQKKNRPIASGAVPVVAASTCSVACVVTAFILASNLPTTFVLLLAAYVTLSLCYTVKLKHYPLFDLMCIALGFIFRLYAGGAVFHVEISDWLFLTVFLLALFLSTGKRLSEKKMLGSDGLGHRRALDQYSISFLEGTMYMTASAVLVTYTMYVITHHFLVYTVPLCTFGLLRYLLRVQQGKTGDPTESLLSDGALLGVSLVWVMMVGWGIYGGRF